MQPTDTNATQGKKRERSNILIVQLKPEKKAAFRRYAFENDTTMSDITRELITDFLAPAHSDGVLDFANN